MWMWKARAPKRNEVDRARTRVTQTRRKVSRAWAKAIKHRSRWHGHLEDVAKLTQPLKAADSEALPFDEIIIPLLMGVAQMMGLKDKEAERLIFCKLYAVAQEWWPDDHA